MAETTATVALTKQEKKIQKGLERLRAKFGQDAVLARAASAVTRTDIKKTTGAAETKSGNGTNAKKVQKMAHSTVVHPDSAGKDSASGTPCDIAKKKRSHRAEPADAICQSAIAVEREAAEKRITSVCKKRRCSVNTPQFIWTDRNEVEIAWHVLMDLSLRNAPDAEVYLERELSTFGATTSREEFAFLGGALLHCADRGFLSCVRLLLARSASVEYVSSDTRMPRRIKLRTPLELAAARGHVEVCRALVEQGAAIGRAREAAARLSQFGEYFSDERSALLALFSGSMIPTRSSAL